jgi:hypothetical protein
VQRLPLGAIALPDVTSPPELGELRRQAERQEARRRACAAGEAFTAAAGCGWEEPWPQLVLGDGVRFFDELSASGGALGRFTGASVMPIIKQLSGRGRALQAV